MLSRLLLFSIIGTCLCYKIHCGPKKLSYIPHVFIDQLVTDLAIELAEAANDIWEVRKNEGWIQKEGVMKIVNVAGTVHTPWEDRISSVTFLFSEMKNKQADGIILWMAEFECIRVEKWAKLLTLLGVRDVTGLLEKIISYPWNRTTEWEEKTIEMKARTVAWLIKKEICF